MPSEVGGWSTIVPRKIEKRNRKNIRNQKKNKILASAATLQKSTRNQNLCSGFLCFLFLVFFLVFSLSFYFRQ
jgi:hypothetical protein